MPVWRSTQRGSIKPDDDDDDDDERRFSSTIYRTRNAVCHGLSRKTQWLPQMHFIDVSSIISSQRLLFFPFSPPFSVPPLFLPFSNQPLLPTTTTTQTTLHFNSVFPRPLSLRLDEDETFCPIRNSTFLLERAGDSRYQRIFFDFSHRHHPVTSVYMYVCVRACVRV